MASWDNFFVAQVGAAGALAGLVFVGVSLNYKKILSLPQLPNRALEALILLLANLLTSSLFLTPQNVRVIGAETLALGLIVLVTVVRLNVQNLRVTEPAFLRPNILLGLIGSATTAFFPAGGAAVLICGEVGLFVLLPGILLSYAVALLNAWVLTIEINR